jgi:hypothetical protein
LWNPSYGLREYGVDTLEEYLTKSESVADCAGGFEFVLDSLVPLLNLRVSFEISPHEMLRLWKGDFERRGEGAWRDNVVDCVYPAFRERASVLIHPAEYIHSVIVVKVLAWVTEGCF